MNKEACFKSLLEQRDALILELDTKCKELERERGDKKRSVLLLRDMGSLAN